MKCSELRTLVLYARIVLSFSFSSFERMDTKNTKADVLHLSIMRLSMFDCDNASLSDGDDAMIVEKSLIVNSRGKISI